MVLDPACVARLTQNIPPTSALIKETKVTSKGHFPDQAAQKSLSCPVMRKHQWFLHGDPFGQMVGNVFLNITNIIIKSCICNSLAREGGEIMRTAPQPSGAVAACFDMLPFSFCILL